MGRHAVLTGTPGVGKTTLVQKICKILQTKGVPTVGFVTQEVREHGQRTGFQVITMEGEAGVLSSINSRSTSRVGQYGVEVTEFEKLALPVFSNLEEKAQARTVLVIDEIGKMEMFSRAFTTAVSAAFQTPGIRILATIPVPKGRPIPFVENIRHHPDASLFEVSRSNRDIILEDVLKAILCE